MIALAWLMAVAQLQNAVPTAFLVLPPPKPSNAQVAHCGSTNLLKLPLNRKAIKKVKLEITLILIQFSKK
jgi:hypothetical protein